MGLFDQFPYTNFHELNLMWILKALKEIQTTTEQFVAINSLKYADPIQWDITRQYEKNTIVIDPQSGTAYISTQPVPVGVALTNPDYWNVVFDLEQFVTKANNNFTPRVEEATTLTATFPTNLGEWVIWGGLLYEAQTNIIAGDQYVVGSNITRITVEDIKNRIYKTIDDLATEILGKIGDLEDLTTQDKSNLVAAINEIASEVLGKIGDLNDLTTQDKSNLVAAINEVITMISDIPMPIKTPEMFGAIGDGITDDTAAFNNALAGGGYILCKANATYLVDAVQQLLVDNNTILNLNGSTIKAKPNNAGYYNIIMIDCKHNVVVENGVIIGDRDGHTGTSGEWGYGVYVHASNDVLINNLNITKCWGDGIAITNHETEYNNGYRAHNIKVTNNKITDCRRQGISVMWCYDVFIHNNIIKDIGGTAPGCAIDCEPNPGQTTKNIVISNNIFENTAHGIDVSGTATGSSISDIMILNNILKHTNAPGWQLQIATASDIIIRGNDISIGNTTGAAVNFDKTQKFIFEDNYLHDSHATGAISILYCSAQSTGAIKSNRFENCSSEIHLLYILSVPNVEFNDNEFINCACGATGRGIIYLTGATSCIFKNNTIKGCTGANIFMVGADATGNTFVNNHIDSTASYIFHNTTAGTSNNIFFNDMKAGTVATITGLGGTWAGIAEANIIDGVFTTNE